MVEKAAIKIDSKEWDRFMEKVGKKLLDPKPMMRAAYNTAGFRDIISHFDEERGPEGPWPKRSENTQFRYAMIASGRWAPPAAIPAAAFNPSNKILVQTGALRQGFLPGNVRDKGRTAIEVFNNDQKSGQHDEGAGRIPARPFMWLSDQAQEKMAEIILSFLADEKGGL